MAIARVTARRLLWPLVLALVAVVLYDTSIKRRNMVDFGVYRVAAGRAIAAEPLYREDDGHYKFKYLPAFAFAMAPFAWLEASTAKALWFALSVGLLAALLRWSVWALPGRRRPVVVIIVLTIVVMAKFYGHELTLGQSNILLGTVLVAALVSVAARLPLVAGALLGLAVFVKPYAVILLPWALVSCGLSAGLVSAAVKGCLVGAIEWRHVLNDFGIHPWDRRFSVGAVDVREELQVRAVHGASQREYAVLRIAGWQQIGDVNLPRDIVFAQQLENRLGGSLNSLPWAGFESAGGMHGSL